MASKRKLVVIDGDSGEVTPVGFKAKNRVALPMTPRKALREAASTYAAARRGELPVDVASRLVYMARQCADIHEIAEVEPRLTALEDRIERLMIVLERGAAMRFDPALLPSSADSESVEHPSNDAEYGSASCTGDANQ